MFRRDYAAVIACIERAVARRQFICNRLGISWEELAEAQSGAYKDEDPQFFEIYETDPIPPWPKERR